ncbi:DUF1501 domain-containing protein [Aquabacterium sp.]|uniref:DUF1501 domain-containing protein n=1 Tax=Aquabacterium sp. TaxID=1872578 RepID=UPI002C30848F|nr:DUF1501 domain-containing protein [Aquabacterium sp.]HSW06449.1 DUF1501 domain-containing protein [Aquabacterium sp.]
MNTSRRHFLHAAAALGASTGLRAAPLAMSLAGLSALSAQSAHAADVSNGYRALVCLFFAGGSDGHNWVVPIESTEYAQYAAVRRELTWNAAQLQPITSSTQGTGRRFGMPMELQPLRDLYEAGRAAIIANIGTLERPVSKAEYSAGIGLPSKLFSHNDQQSVWQSLSPEGARSGWGGRMGDILMSANANPVFTAISTSGNAVFLSGNAVTQYQVGTEGPVLVKALTDSWTLGSSTVATPLRRTLARGGSHVMQSEYTRVMQRSLDTSAALQSALAGVAVPALPTTPITLPSGATITLSNESVAKQLRMVAQLVGAGQTLGLRRQVFMVNMGGFDTHANQMRDQPLLMAKVAQSIGYFMTALQSIGLMNNVMLFTASDFGRTLTSNGDGSDHGWGSHHFVAGGAVRGREIYGRLPVTALGTADEVGSGRLLPSTGVTQLAATLGGWMGLSPVEQAMVLPNLGAFPAAPLGFV